MVAVRSCSVSFARSGYTSARLHLQLTYMNRSIAAGLGIVTIALVQPATIAAEVNGGQARSQEIFRCWSE